jgi:hypothetical protein
MNTIGIDDHLRELCEQNAPPFDKAGFAERLDRRRRPPLAQCGTSKRRSRLRVAVLASIAVLLVAALTSGTLRLVTHLGEDHYVLVIGDGSMTTADASTPGLYPVFVGGKWGYIDNSGAIKIDPRFDSAYDFSEGLARVILTVDGVPKQGYIDTAGAIVIQPQFSYAQDFSGGMAVVAKIDDGGNPTASGYIDASGSIVIPMQYEYALDFSEGLGLVGGADGRSYFIDAAGKAVLGPYVFARSFSEGLAYVQVGGKGGFIDKNGRRIVDLESMVIDASSFISSFYPSPKPSGGLSEGLMPLRSTSGVSSPAVGNADQGYVDKTGAWVIEPQFTRACDFAEGLAAVEILDDGLRKWGYIDRTGAWIIQPQFEYAWHFAEGMAVVGSMKDGYMEYGYIDQTGTLVIPMQYAQAGDFSGGIARVVCQSDAYTSGHPSYVDKTGRVIWQAQ